ncbi:MAG: pyridoxamine 5'-phosphate oxidase [Nocardioides sp.]|nr:pyridoxamine 5'-phosphate oxidase [Nocardioides sp.]
MHETDDDLRALQQLLDASHGDATDHLRDIITDDRRLTARDVVGLMTGMKVLSLATTTAAGEPRVSAVDGHFLRGTWSFSTSGTAAKARHLAARPACSVAHVDGERLAVFSHGHVTRYAADDPDFAPVHRHWCDHYGSDPLTWGDDIAFYRYRSTWMVGYAWKRAEVLAEAGLTP